MQKFVTVYVNSKRYWKWGIPHGKHAHGTIE
jgi:hypothetical protein